MPPLVWLYRLRCNPYVASTHVVHIWLPLFSGEDTVAYISSLNNVIDYYISSFINSDTLRFQKNTCPFPEIYVFLSCYGEFAKFSAIVSTILVSTSSSMCNTLLSSTYQYIVHWFPSMMLFTMHLSYEIPIIIQLGQTMHKMAQTVTIIPTSTKKL